MKARSLSSLSLSLSLKGDAKRDAPGLRGRDKYRAISRIENPRQFFASRAVSPDN